MGARLVSMPIKQQILRVKTRQVKEFQLVRQVRLQTPACHPDVTMRVAPCRVTGAASPATPNGCPAADAPTVLALAPEDSCSLW